MIVLRPKLIMDTTGPFCRKDDVFDGDDPITILRIHVRNLGYRATEVTAYVEKVWRNEVLVESKRSPLISWMDLAVEKVTLRHLEDEYIDLCLVPGHSPNILRVRTKRGSAGFNFSSPGIYRFLVSVQGEGFHSGYQMEVEVSHTGSRKDLRIISTGRHVSQLRAGGVILKGKNEL